MRIKTRRLQKTLVMLFFLLHQLTDGAGGGHLVHGTVHITRIFLGRAIIKGNHLPASHARTAEGLGHTVKQMIEEELLGELGILPYVEGRINMLFGIIQIKLVAQSRATIEQPTSSRLMIMYLLLVKILRQSYRILHREQTSLPYVHKNFVEYVKNMTGRQPTQMHSYYALSIKRFKNAAIRGW